MALRVQSIIMDGIVGIKAVEYVVEDCSQGHWQDKEDQTRQKKKKYELPQFFHYIMYTYTRISHCISYMLNVSNI